MFLEIVDVGKIKVDRVAIDEEDCLQLFSENQFRELRHWTLFPVEAVHVCQSEDSPEWFLFAQVAVPFECEILVDDLRVFYLKNQADVYKLKAFL